MTRFRERLPRLRHVERDYARETIDRDARSKSRKFDGVRSAPDSPGSQTSGTLSRTGNTPAGPHYEDFPQLEDGIGTVRLFLEDAKAVSRRRRRAWAPVSATLVTAEMPALTVQRFADRLNRIDGVDVNVCVVKNDFFGGDIHIAGLLTAQDILAHLDRFPDTRNTIYIPQICLRDLELFLDDVTLAEARERSGLDLRPVGNRPRDLAAALGLLASGRRGYPVSRHWITEESIVT